MRLIFYLSKVFIFFKHQCNPLQNSSLGQLHSDGDVVPNLLAVLEVFNRYGLQNVLHSFGCFLKSWNGIFWVHLRRFAFYQKKKSALIWSSIYPLELSLVEETSQCDSPYFASWSQDCIKNPWFITCDHTTKEILLIGDSVKKIKALLFLIVTDHTGWRLPALLPKVGTMSP